MYQYNYNSFIRYGIPVMSNHDDVIVCSIGELEIESMVVMESVGVESLYCVVCFGAPD